MNATAPQTLEGVYDHAVRAITAITDIVADPTDSYDDHKHGASTSWWSPRLALYVGLDRDVPHLIISAIRPERGRVLLDVNIYDPTAADVDAALSRLRALLYGEAAKKEEEAS